MGSDGELTFFPFLFDDLRQISSVQMDDQRVMISYYCKTDPFEGEHSTSSLPRVPFPFEHERNENEKDETDASFVRSLPLPVSTD